ncbi:MAG: GspH/FimT family pseudopilin [Victivallaceae bacterium]|nr:GspH/FimT family pseudopilin [Victivallaceae bacterium]
MKRYRNNFTLIELLLVLAIMGIIMGAGFSGLSRMSKGQAVNGAVRSIAGQISLARSYAVSQNRYVALILPNHVDSNFDSNDGDSYVMQKTRICFIDKDSTTGVFDFDEWVSSSQWKKIPQGALAIISTENVADLDTTPAPPQSPIAGNLEIVNNIEYTNDKNVDETTGVSPAIIFSPSGALVNSESYITVFWGIYPFKIDSNRPTNLSTTPNGAARDEEYELNDTDKGRWWRLNINKFTGRTYFDRFKAY